MEEYYRIYVSKIYQALFIFGVYLMFIFARMNGIQAVYTMKGQYGRYPASDILNAQNPILLGVGAATIILLAAALWYWLRRDDFRTSAFAARKFETILSLGLIGAGGYRLIHHFWAIYQTGNYHLPLSSQISIVFGAFLVISGFMIVTQHHLAYKVAALVQAFQIPVIISSGGNYMLQNGPSMMLWLSPSRIGAVDLFSYQTSLNLTALYGQTTIGLNLFALYLVYLFWTMPTESDIAYYAGMEPAR